MKCWQCGWEGEQQNRFCVKCGAELRTIDSGQLHRKKTRKYVNSILGVITVFLAVIFIVQSVTGFRLFVRKKTGNPIADIMALNHGYKYQGEVIEKFSRAISSNDVDGALSLFAVDDVLENYDYNMSMSYWSAYPYTLNTFPRGELFDEVDRYALYQMKTSEIERMMLSLCVPGEVDRGRYIEDSKEAEEIANRMNLKNLDGFKLVRLDKVEYNDYFDRMYEVLGKSGYTEYTVLYEYNGEYWAGGISLVSPPADGNWYIYKLGTSAYGGLENGSLIKMNEAEYERLLEEVDDWVWANR